MNNRIIEGKFDFKGFQTYYRVVNPEGKKTPIIMLHGGPGSTHNYFEVFDDMAFEDDRPIIMYDQIGCGESFVTGHPELFTAEVWMDELEALIKHLDLKEIHILGQSWGGMLAIWYAIERKPKNVVSYILSSTLSSASLWKKEQYRRISYMDQKDQEAIDYAIKNEAYDNKEYLEAVDKFMELYCAGAVTEESPEFLRRKKIFGEESYIVGWGQNEFSPTGTLSKYEFTDKLSEINTKCLITSGQRDLCSPFIAKTMHDNLKDSKWELFAYSRHTPFIEESEKYIKVLTEWLNEFE